MKLFRIILIIFLIVSLAVYPLFFNLLGGAGLVAGAYNNYKDALIDYEVCVKYIFLGAMMILSSVTMTSATVLCMSRKNISAVITDTVGFLFCLAVVLLLRENAGLHGMSDDITLKPYVTIYTERHLPSVIHLAALTVLSFVQKSAEEKDRSYEMYVNVMHYNDIDDL